MAELIRDPHAGMQFFIPGVAFSWRGRDGTHHTIQFPADNDEAIEWARQEAERLGYPGHPGWAWDYFKDDLRALWRRILHKD